MSKANTMSSAKRARSYYPFTLPTKLIFFIFAVYQHSELKSVFDQIQAAEKAGNLSPEEKKKLEGKAAEKGLQALFKV